MFKGKSQSEVRYDFTPGTEHAVVSKQTNLPPKVGLYSGSFDPVHAGHIIFALKAQKIAGLEHVYFMPERKPKRHKEPEHYVHRTVMLKHALKPYAQFSPLDLPDARLSSHSLPRLSKVLPGADLSLLTTASDLLWHEGELPKIYYKLHLIIAVTSHMQMVEVLQRVTGASTLFHNLTFVDIGTTHISSAAVRNGIRKGQAVRGLLPSVWRYAKQQWLYLPPIHR